MMSQWVSIIAFFKWFPPRHIPGHSFWHTILYHGIMDFMFRHSIWQSSWDILWHSFLYHTLNIYDMLAFFLACYLEFILTLSDIFSGIYSGFLPHILPDILSGMLSGIYLDMLSGILASSLTVCLTCCLLTCLNRVLIYVINNKQISLECGFQKLMGVPNPFSWLWDFLKLPRVRKIWF